MRWRADALLFARRKRRKRGEGGKEIDKYWELCNFEDENEDENEDEIGKRKTVSLLLVSLDFRTFPSKL
jgi:hypothetical protein